MTLVELPRTAVEIERDFWEEKAAISEQSAIEAIAADPSAWNGQSLMDCMFEVLKPFPVVPVGIPRRILDLGCGMGRLTIPLAKNFSAWQFVGVDISPSMLERAQGRSAGLQNVSWQLCDGRTLPDMGMFDAAYSMITLQHIPSVAQMDYIRQVGRMLYAGGVFRFQILEGLGESFMWALLDEPRIAEAATDVGLVVTAFDKAAYQPDPNVTVRWVTLEKPR